MATSSFGSTIKINKKSANSLIKILEGEICEYVDLNTSIEVKKRLIKKERKEKKMEKEIENVIAIFKKAVA